MLLRPSWQAASCSNTPEVRDILWKKNTYYRVHKGHQLFPVQSQKYPVHILQTLKQNYSLQRELETGNCYLFKLK
jgi:hypothetical protein